jgi:myo-inositol-1(or 4)-monophosphatase
MSCEVELLDGIVSVVREASEIIKDHAKILRDIHFKGRINLVTATDIAVEEFLREKLAGLLPGSSFLAEETSPDTDLAENTWIIDPVDGMTNFAHGLPFVATSVGLWRNGKVSLGVINAPLLDECFTAVKGRGAFRNGEPVTVSATSRLDHSLIATGFLYSMEKELPGLLRRIGRVFSNTRGVRRYGAAALDLAYVATGRYDGFYERSLSPWDIAAGWLLVKEAGGVLTRTDGSVFTLREHDVLAMNGTIHTALQELRYDEEDAES